MLLMFKMINMINKHIKCEKNFNVNLISLNYRVIEVTPVINKFLKFEDYNIQELDYPSFKVKKGETIKINNESFKVSDIKFKKNEHFSKVFLYSSTLNKSSNFVLPFILKTRNEISWDKYFMNCYIGKEGENDYGKHIYIHLRYKPVTELEIIEKNLIENENFLDCRDIDKQYMLFKFKVPEDLKEDLDLLIQGKYSKISDYAKSRICYFHNAKEESQIFKVLNKKESLRLELENQLGEKIDENAELISVFEENQETFLKSYIL